MSATGQLMGQVAWITGSSRGLGRVMAEELSRRGAKVAVHGTRADSPTTFGEGGTMQELADELAREHAVETLATWGDLTQEAEVHRIAEEIRRAWGRIDLLICCAGGDIGAGGTGQGQGGRPERDDCLNISLADLASVMDRNLLSVILCCREIVPEMQARKQGRIVTIGSIAGCAGEKPARFTRLPKPPSTNTPAAWPPNCGRTTFPSTAWLPAAR